MMTFELTINAGNGPGWLVYPFAASLLFRAYPDALVDNSEYVQYPMPADICTATMNTDCY